MIGRGSLWRLAVVVAVLVLAPSLVWASEHGGEEPSIFQGGIHNVIWTLIIFLTVVTVLGKFAWGPVLGALQNRETFIRESIENARKEREEAAKLLEQYTEQINRAREEATAICDEGRRDGEVVRKQLEADARAEAEAMVERAKREIGLAHQDAVRAIYDDTAELATRVAAQILNREVNVEDHRQLVASSLEEMRRQAEETSN